MGDLGSNPPAGVESGLEATSSTSQVSTLTTGIGLTLSVLLKRFQWLFKDCIPRREGTRIGVSHVLVP